MLFLTPVFIIKTLILRSTYLLKATPLKFMYSPINFLLATPLSIAFNNYKNVIFSLRKKFLPSYTNKFLLNKHNPHLFNTNLTNPLPIQSLRINKMFLIFHNKYKPSKPGHLRLNLHNPLFISSKKTMTSKTPKSASFLSLLITPTFLNLNILSQLHYSYHLSSKWHIVFKALIFMVFMSKVFISIYILLNFHTGITLGLFLKPKIWD